MSLLFELKCYIIIYQTNQPYQSNLDDDPMGRAKVSCAWIEKTHKIFEIFTRSRFTFTFQMLYFNRHLHFF